MLHLFSSCVHWPLGIGSICLAFFFLSPLCGSASAQLSISLDPPSISRSTQNGANTFRVLVKAADAQDLLSFAVRLSYDEAVLELVEGTLGSPWPAGIGPRQEMDGQHLYGAAISPVNGDVVLAELVFRVVPGAEVSATAIDIGLAKSSPALERFAHFVDAAGSVLEDTAEGVLFSAPMQVCLSSPGMLEPCECDQDGNGVVDYFDYAALVAKWGAKAGEAAYSGSLDADGDGVLGAGDFASLAEDWGRSDCPLCPAR
jgi:hypothetical protein